MLGELAYIDPFRCNLAHIRNESFTLATRSFAELIFSLFTHHFCFSSFNLRDIEMIEYIRHVTRNTDNYTAIECGITAIEHHTQTAQTLVNQ